MVVVVVDEQSVCLLTMSKSSVGIFGHPTHSADSVPVQFRRGEFLHSGGI
jgi:hypothetical protein